TVTAHPHGVAGTAGDHTGTGSSSPITVTGLTNGTSYDISVVATNSAGDGPAGTTTVTPVGPPGAPTSVSASVADSQTVVSFTAPASNGGSAITGYTVTAHPHGAVGTS